MNDENVMQTEENLTEDQWWVILYSIITDYPVQEWNKFADDLIYTNRFSSSHKVVDVIKAHAKKSAATIKKGKSFIGQGYTIMIH